MKTNEVPTLTPTGSTNEPITNDHRSTEPDAAAAEREPADSLADEHDPADDRADSLAAEHDPADDRADSLAAEHDPADAGDEPVADPTGQLLLLPELVAASDPLSSSNAHARFRLSKQTRERGLRHVAEIRAQLAEAKERNAKSNVVALPPRRTPAA